MEPESIAKIAAAAALEKKATDVVILDLRGISTFTDFFVICSGESEPQLKAIKNEIEDTLRDKHHVRPVAFDGQPGSQWLVIDYLQVIVHVFHQERRGFYALEDLWNDAPKIEIN